ncbi:cytidylyltransferase (HIGH family) exon [Cryptosporidium xiaoi]|uniref:Cytidylyltransferase (HIGH family) exon n=1 Tax=Cryptosporidium xiaoi TaxID=659607 RepID=A0AAV9Y0M1_9CRYT
MQEIDRGFFILDPQWWNNITTSDEARNIFFRLLYSCISHTSHSLFIYYSVTLHENESREPDINLESDVLKESTLINKNIYSRMTCKHINSIIKAYEIALDVIELLDKIPTFDIRFIPVKNDCVNHIFKTIGPDTQLNHWLNSYTFCERNGDLIHCADTINSIVSSFVQDRIHYLRLFSDNESINSLVCSKFFDQFVVHGFPYFEITDNIEIPRWNNKLNVITNNDNRKFIENPVNRTLFAGTFDRLHPGHKINITVATWYAKEMAIIGITDTPLLVNKRDKDILQDFSIRSANVLSFIFSLYPEISITLLRISSIIGGADIFEFDALIATPESINNAKKINDQRLNKGFPLVQLVEVPFVYKPQLSEIIQEKNKANESSEIITSTELRLYLKKNLDGSNNRLLLKNAINELFFQSINLDVTKSRFVGLINLINSFVDDIIFEILHRWKKLYGNEKGRYIFEKWLYRFISDMNSEGKKYLKAKEINKGYTKGLESIAVILIYLIVTLNLLKRNSIAIQLDVINKMCILFLETLKNTQRKDGQSCGHPEYCIPYMYCYSGVEKNIFFGNNFDLTYSKLQYKNQSYNSCTGPNIEFDIPTNKIVDENHFISFDFVLKSIFK